MVKVAAFLVVLGIGAALLWANWPSEKLPVGTVADLVVVEKSKHVLQLYADGNLVASFPVSLGSSPLGPKRQEGDGRTPEGNYTLDYRKADSSFYRALHISYPSAADATEAHSRGVDPGGQIMIHGLPNGLRVLGRLQRLIDWTDGCIAVTDEEMEEVWEAVPDGTRIRIEP